MSTRRRCTRCRASRRRSASRVTPERSSGRSRERWVEKREQRSEGIILSAVRGCRDEDEVAVLVAAERLEQFVALVASAVGGAERERVGFVDDHQLRAGADEVLAAPVGLDEVRRDDDVAGSASNSDRPTRQAALQPLDGARAGRARRARWNFVHSSRCHCSARCGGQSTARR